MTIEDIVLIFLGAAITALLFTALVRETIRVSSIYRKARDNRDNRP